MSRQFFVNFRWGMSGEAQEMLVDGGTVVFRQPPEPGFIEGAEIVDLEGAYLLPAFIDSHCHILPTGLDLAKLHLGALTTPTDVLDAVRQRDRELPEGEWLLAVHYDQTRFSDGHHMGRTQLDAAVPKRPVLLRHANGHASVANSAALLAAGIDETANDPKGGTFVRDSSGRLTGVLLEKAHEQVTAAAPKPDLEKMVLAILAASEKMAELGIVCASDMMTGVFDLELELEAYRMALERGGKVDLRLYLQWSTVLGPRAIDSKMLAAHRAKFEATAPPLGRRSGRICGLKVFADGALGSATAAIHGKFLTTGENGQLIYSPERLRQMVREGHDAGYPIAIHSIGDRSTDLVMDALEAVGDASRHRIEHAMILSDAQIERLARVGSTVTMQPEFLRQFAHAYRRQLPDSVSSKLERFRSVQRAGIRLALNSDRPIVPGDPWVGVLTASHRPEGYDESENLDRADAIRAYLETAARANGEAEAYGRLIPGSRADFCTYRDDPVTATAPKIERIYRSGARSDP